MKIIHFVGGDLHSGSSKAVITLSRNLNKLKNINSKIYNKKSNSKIFFEKVFKRSNFKKQNTTISLGIFGNNFLYDKNYINADIVHLHWINKSLININDILKINKPIVWTVRDMWPFTGVCHYTYDCEKYIKECGKCPQLNSNVKKDWSYKIFHLKNKIFSKKDITFITNSQWITNKAKKSKLLKNKKIIKLYNSFETRNFYPINKIKAKNNLNFDKNKKLILFGANNASAKYKGLKYFVDSINELKSNNIEIGIIGNIWERKIFKRKDIKIKFFGNINETSKLRKIYSAADLFVAPSIQDAFPKMPVEAMLCETPCVYFKSTSISEINKDGYTGFGANYQNFSNLASAINKSLKSKKKLGKNARKHILKNYSQKKLTEKITNIYRNSIK